MDKPDPTGPDSGGDGTSLQGNLLVATPELRDPNFFHTVVLLVRHDEEEGALGLVLNRPSTTKLKEVWDKISEAPCQTSEVLRVGGPCPGPPMALHCHDFLVEIEILPRIFFTKERENLDRLVQMTDEPARFFVGYAGWTTGQLEHEIGEGSWKTLQATWQHVFGDEGALWERVYREITGQQLIQTLGIKHVPPDLSVN